MFSASLEAFPLCVVRGKKMTRRLREKSCRRSNLVIRELQTLSNYELAVNEENSTLAATSISDIMLAPLTLMDETERNKHRVGRGQVENCRDVYFDQIGIAFRKKSRELLVKRLRMDRVDHEPKLKNYTLQISHGWPGMMLVLTTSSHSKERAIVYMQKTSIAYATMLVKFLCQSLLLCLPCENVCHLGAPCLRRLLETYVFARAGRLKRMQELGKTKKLRKQPCIPING
jgi:hypothetical protein